MKNYEEEMTRLAQEQAQQSERTYRQIFIMQVFIVIFLCVGIIAQIISLSATWTKLTEKELESQRPQSTQELQESSAKFHSGFWLCFDS